MSTDAIIKKFDHIYAQISTPQFLRMEALGGEVPFFITSYDQRNADVIDQEINRLSSRMRMEGISVATVNLLDVVLNILEEKELLEPILTTEADLSKDELFDIFSGALDVQNYIVPKIEQILKEKADSQIVFLTGIGAVFPYIRSHIILNNLQNAIKHIPTLMFFPGVYNTVSLSLFGRMKDDNYYRAFNLDTLNLKDRK
jgi:signal transduction histidine kinase